jgi:hypothetical protein
MGYDRHIQPEAPIDLRRSLIEVAQANLPVGGSIGNTKAERSACQAHLQHAENDFAFDGRDQPLGAMALNS